MPPKPNALCGVSAPPQRKPEPQGTRLDIKYVMEVASHDARPSIEVLERRAPPSGRPEPWQTARVSPKNLIRFPSAADRAVVSRGDRRVAALFN